MRYAQATLLSLTQLPYVYVIAHSSLEAGKYLDFRYEINSIHPQQMRVATDIFTSPHKPRF